MHPVLLEIGRFNVYSWGFMLAIAVIVGIIGVGRIFQKHGYDRDMVLDAVILMVIFGIIGGRAAYILIYEWTAFLANPLSFFSLSNGGFSGLIWYGGFIGGLLALIIYVWRKGLSFWDVADMFSPYLALGYALVRIGCFLNGCCYGLPTDSIFGIVFPGVDEIPRHPTQLYSSVLNVILFAYLLWLLQRRKFTGQIFAVYIMGYSVYRFIIEFFRFSLVDIGPLTLGQVYTAGLFVIGLAIFLLLRFRGNDTIYVTRGYR